MVEIEAESLGKPLIATDLGFSVEAIENGRNGYKIPLGDADAFQKTITDLWERKEDIHRMGELARKDYEQKYTPEDNFCRLMKIYSEVTEK